MGGRGARMTLDEILEAVQAGKLSPDAAERALVALRRGTAAANDARVGTPNEDVRREQRPADAIAIIGMAGRFPEAETIDELWEHLRDGRDLIREIPGDRWSLNGEAPACKWGGFMRNVGRCDPRFFAAMTPAIELTDPDELAFAEVIWTLFEHAGYARTELQRCVAGNVGLYLGARANGVSGGLPVVMANRISSFFGLTGPSFTIDAMSASSMSALHLACRALSSGDCKMAIAAGVSVLSEASYGRMNGVGILAGSADVRSFSNGRAMLPSEAMCAVLIKPLSDALRDGDHVFAVIRATALANAATFSQVAPPKAKLIENVLQRAGVDARTIGYVETAAAGDALTDAVEISALTSAFRPYGVAPASCPVGSVKSNLGHALAASGLTQLTKVILQLQHGALAPSIKANPAFPASPFYLQRDLSTWRRTVIESSGQATEYPRRAIVDSYGGGGSMVCAIVEEFSPEQDPAFSETATEELIVLSAVNGAQLESCMRKLDAWLERQPHVSLRDLAYTLQVGREALTQRVAIRAGDVEELRACLAKLLASQEAAVDGNRIWMSGCESAYLQRDVAGRWVQGETIDWIALRGNVCAQRLPLPTYPFDRE